jgi:hypothetical protein
VSPARSGLEELGAIAAELFGGDVFSLFSEQLPAVEQPVELLRV